MVSDRRHLGWRVWLSLGAFVALGLLVAGQAQAAIQIERFEFASREADGEPSVQAGGHPYEVTAGFAFTGDEGHSGLVTPHDLILDLPTGLAGNPTATPTCDELAFQAAQCPPSSQIGYAKLSFSSEVALFPLFNLKPLPGVAGEFGFLARVPVRLAIGIRTGEDYGISITTRSLSQAPVLETATLTLWGVPADPSHDGFRGRCLSSQGPTGELCPSEVVPRPLLTNPSTCLPALSVTAQVDSWHEIGIFDRAMGSNEDSMGRTVGIVGCGSLGFHPSLSIAPSSLRPGTPSGLTAQLRAPQVQDPDNPAEASLAKGTVVLPKGVAISPPAADGLGTCSQDQIRLGDDSQPSCPDSSKLGTMTIATPMLDSALSGSVYLATPQDNPFATRFAVYAVASGDGVLIKLAGRVDPDPVTGQLRLSFQGSPQLPFSEVKIRLFDGPRAALSTPPRCGTYVTESELIAWGAVSAVTPTASFELTSGCPGPRFAPDLEAASRNPAAGSYSPFALRLRRGEKDGEFASLLSLELPPGVSAALTEATYCPESMLGTAGPLPACPNSSRVGNATIRAGAGPSPLLLIGGVYLAGPYKDAPLSLAVVVPARAGPFDLGTIVERVGVSVDPRTAQLSIRADPLPQIRDGVPLALRSLTLDLDHPGFVRNPTSCGSAAITGSAATDSGRSALLSAPLQVGGCAGLAFKPKLSLNLRGPLGRNGHPVLRAVLRARSHEAGIAAAAITLPPSELLDLRQLGTLCPRELPADRCPPSSRLGRAWIASPLLGVPLHGPIYLRAPSGRLPDLIGDLRGGGLHLLLPGRTIARAGRLGIRLPALPDVPLTKAVVTLGGGSRGILVNSEGLCHGTRRGAVSLTAHNGQQRHLRPLLRLEDRC